MKKIIIVGLIFLFIIVSSTTIYAYSELHADNYLKESEQVIVIKDQLNSNSDKNLIPLGCILSVGDTYYVDYYYEVEVANGLDFDTVIDNIHFIKGDNIYENNDLFNFEISYQVVSEFDNTVNVLLNAHSNMTYLVKVTVSMNEPLTEEVFNNVINSKLYFDVAFIASV